MHVAVKGAQRKNVKAVDVKQFEEPVVAQFAGFEQFIEAAAGNESDTITFRCTAVSCSGAERARRERSNVSRCCS